MKFNSTTGSKASSIVPGWRALPLLLSCASALLLCPLPGCSGTSEVEDAEVEEDDDGDRNGTAGGNSAGAGGNSAGGGGGGGSEDKPSGGGTGQAGSSGGGGPVDAPGGNAGAGGGGSGAMGGNSAGTGGSAGGGAGCPQVPTRGLKVRFAAGSGITAEGAGLAKWVDQVSSIEASQGEASRRPSVRSNAINGKPVIRFDGDNDFLSFPFPVTGRDKLSIVTIGRTWQFQRGSENNDCDFDKDGVTDVGRELNCSGTDQGYLTWNEGGNGFRSTGIFLGLGQTEATFRFGTGRNYRFFKTPFVLEKPLGDKFVWSAAVMDGMWRTLYVNNEIPRGRTNYRDAQLFELRTRADQDDKGSMQPGWPSAVGDTEPVAWLGRGRFNPASSFWAGEIAELIIYEAALEEAERQQLKQYVGCTFGLP